MSNTPIVIKCFVRVRHTYYTSSWKKEDLLRLPYTSKSAMSASEATAILLRFDYLLVRLRNVGILPGVRRTGVSHMHIILDPLLIVLYRRA